MSSNARVRQKEETRASLLDAARTCFAEKGWAGTVVSDVVRAAGVAHGTFYVHFESKDAVADALLADFNAGLLTRVAAAVERAEDLESRVRAAARAFLAALAAERAFVRWYAERLTQGLAGDALIEGINPEARALLDAWLAREGVGEAHRAALVPGLLALFIRVGVRAALGAGSARAAEDVIVASTLGAVSALGRKSSSRRSR